MNIFHLILDTTAPVSDVWTPGYCGGHKVGLCGDGSTVEGGYWCSDKGTQADCERHCVSGGYACCSWADRDQCQGYSSLRIIDSDPGSYKYMVPNQASKF